MSKKSKKTNPALGVAPVPCGHSSWLRTARLFLLPLHAIAVTDHANHGSDVHNWKHNPEDSFIQTCGVQYQGTKYNLKDCKYFQLRIT